MGGPLIAIPTSGHVSDTVSALHHRAGLERVKTLDDGDVFREVFASVFYFSLVNQVELVEIHGVEPVF